MLFSAALDKRRYYMANFDSHSALVGLIVRELWIDERKELAAASHSILSRSSRVVVDLLKFRLQRRGLLEPFFQLSAQFQWTVGGKQQRGMPLTEDCLCVFFVDG